MKRFTKLDYVECVTRKYPTIRFTSQDGNDYFALEWLSGPSLPTKEQLDADINVLFKYDAVEAIDLKADEVYHAAVSSSAKLLEYLESEADAKRYLADNTASAPYVAVWAEATGWSMVTAAEDILKTANGFRQILIYVRKERLIAKQAIRCSNGDDSVIFAACDQFEAVMDSMIYQIKMGV
jgi:hypothetical protein